MNRPNARSLALRDPALASLMGAIPGADFGDDYGDDYGDDMGDDYGYDFGDDYGYAPSFGAAPLARHGGHPVARPVAPPPALAAKLWAKHRRDTHKTEKRLSLLEPNRGSKVKVERYSFSLNAPLVIGTANPNINTTGAPDVNIRPQRVTMNAPAAGLITVADLKVANVSVNVGGQGDAFEYSPLGVGMTLDMPTLSPANRASFLGSYNGAIPFGYNNGQAFQFCISFKGPASIVA